MLSSMRRRMATEGNVVHYGYIEAFIEELGKRYNVREIAFDRWGAVQMSQNLEGLRLHRHPVRSGIQGHVATYK